jgi:hypothetical protein
MTHEVRGVKIPKRIPKAIWGEASRTVALIHGLGVGVDAVSIVAVALMRASQKSIRSNRRKAKS